jgi:hypothetical protein
MFCAASGLGEVTWAQAVPFHRRISVRRAGLPDAA